MIAHTSAIALTILFIVLIFSLILYFRNYIALYLQFPNIIAYYYVLKYPLRREKNIPVTSYFFQTAVDVCKRYQSQGVVLSWIPRPYLWIFGEEAMKVFSNEYSLIDKVVEFEMIKEVFGNGILTSNGDKWRNRKKLLNPIFHIKMVRDKVSIVNRNAVILVEKLQKMVDEPSIEILTVLQVCSFNNITEFLIGKDFKDPKTIAELQKIMAAVSKGTRMLVYRLFRPWFAPKFILPLSSEGRKYIKMMDDAHDNAKKILKDQIASFVSSKAEMKNNGQQKQTTPSFIQVLIQHHMKDPSFTFDDVLDEFTTFVSAGYDTVSYGMMWCLFLLGHHPEVQEQIYEEVESELRSDMTYEELSNFRYIDCVIKEALRLYPPIPFYGRELVKPISWGNYKIPEGTSVLFFPFMYHRNPDLFPDPEKFDPDRFLDDHDEKKPKTYSFAEGMRNCLGRKFAEIEMKITLAYIIKTFKVISLDRREDLKLNWDVFLTTVEPLHVRLVNRQQNVVPG